MAISTSSYGDTGEIAALTPRYTDATTGLFDATTRPTLTQVESIVDQVSGVVNTILKQYGFAVPVSQSDAKLMLDFFVNEEVAAIVEGINNAGRFGPTSKKPGGAGRFAVIMEDVKMFIEEMQFGIEQLGVTRSQSLTVRYRGTDESGDDIVPLFQRKAFGNTVTNWDS